MIVGGMYALVLAAAPVKTSFMVGSLRAALEDKIPCLLVLSSASDVSSTQALALWGDDLLQATNNKTLRVFLHEQDFKSNLFRYGINRFIQDLELLKPQNKSYIWFDHAEQLFALQDMHFATKQLKILKDWLQAREVTATFVFAKLNTTETHDIHLLSEDLAGLCRIAGGSQGLEANFLHWQSPDGAISHKTYALEETASGFYRATLTARALNPSDKESAEATTQTVQDSTPLYINLDPSVKNHLDSSSIKWQFLDSPLSLFHAVRGSVTPTVVLRFGADTSIRQLAETVHTLRTMIGRGAKIIIHEDKFSLRFNYESLLLRLGANFIMHRDVPPWRLSRVIDSLEGTLFDRAVDVDFGALVSGASPSERSGLVLMDSLVSEIDSILLKTKINNSPKALFIGLVLASRDAQDILSAVHMDRKGDLFAFEGQTIYIFLAACPSSHVTETIERKLKGTLDAIFSSTNIWTETAAIEQQLLILKHRVVINTPTFETIAEEVVAAERTHDFIEPLTQQSAHIVVAAIPEVEAEIEVAVEVEAEAEIEVAVEVEAEIEVEYEQASEPVSVPVDIVMRSPFSVDQINVTTSPNENIVNECVLGSSVQTVTDIFEEPAPGVLEPARYVEEPALDVEDTASQIAFIEQTVDEQLLTPHPLAPISAKFKPLVFLKSRTTGNAPTE